MNRNWIWHIHGKQSNLWNLLSCHPRVTVTPWFVYKVIRDLESIDNFCINPIRRKGLIHTLFIDSRIILGTREQLKFHRWGQLNGSRSFLSLHSSQNLEFSSSTSPWYQQFWCLQKPNKCMERGDLFMFILFCWLKWFYLLVCLVTKCVCYFFLFSSEDICCGCSEGPSEWETKTHARNY